MKKKTISLLLILCMLFTCVLSVSFTASAESVGLADEGAADYGLADTCKDGNILQCFNWTLAQIKAELPNIAAAGFTSVQTSPLQAHDGRNQWYWLYQPTGFTIGNELGSYSDLQSLCTEADKYGIKIIVDVVANHLAGSNSGTLANSVESSLKKSEYFHNLGAGSDWDNRYEVTQKNIGMPDLNSESTAVQGFVAAMITKLQDAGVDGIRWDAAKHIALPSEDCGFWARMGQFDLYQYGEILDAPAGNSGAKVNNALMSEYAEYINVSDDKYSSGFMAAVRDGSTYRTNGYWTRQGLSADSIVYWAETHDTFSNTTGWTKNIDQNVIDRAYAILGAKADSQALYLSRPFETNHTSIYYGRKGSTHFTSKEVAAVNHFHNAMIGAEEKYSTNAGCYIVWRRGEGNLGGAVIVAMSGSDIDVSVTNNSAMVPEGTYTDEVSGSTFTVTSSKITGHIGSTGIAVIYNTDTEPAEVIVGDASLDEEVDIDDATLIQRSDAQMIDLSAEQKAAADADQDGEVTLVDVTAIQRYLADLKHNAPKIGERITVG